MHSKAMSTLSQNKFLESKIEDLKLKKDLNVIQIQPGLLYVRGLKEYVCTLRVTSDDIPLGPPPEPCCSKGE